MDKRFGWAVAAVLALVLGAGYLSGALGSDPAKADVEQGMATGIDFPGGDIERIELTVPDPGLCRQACQANGECRGWTFIKPGIQGPRAVCWVKSAPGIARQDENAISGVRFDGAGPVPGGASVENQMRLGVDFPGNDLQSFALPSGDPRLCQNACNANSACGAWTFAAAGTRAPQAVCWLKAVATTASVAPDLISGGRTVAAATTVGGLGGQFNPNAGANPTTGWGVWASASGGRWEDPCAIQYNAAQLAGNRYDGDQGYRRVRTRDTQQEADLDIDHFGRYNRDQPDDVVKMRPCEAALVDSSGGNAGGGNAGFGQGAVAPANIGGSWRGYRELPYSFSQSGTNFGWSQSDLRETATGTITGNQVSASWSGGNGSGTATGTVYTDGNGYGLRIEWSNGNVFTR